MLGVVGQLGLLVAFLPLGLVLVVLDAVDVPFWAFLWTIAARATLLALLVDPALVA